MRVEKKSLLILDCHQFGYLTDVYKICEHLNSTYNITVVCWDYGKTKMDIEGVNIKYIGREGNILKRNYRILKSYLDFVKLNFDMVFAVYQKGISLVKILSGKKNINLDIRTLSVSRSAKSRFFNDAALKIESLFFKHKSIVSHSLAKKIGFKNYHYLPLGADRICTQTKDNTTLSFIYVGTLTGRDIIKCVTAFEKFLFINSIKDDISFDIIGDGHYNELNELKQFISNSSTLRNVVKCHGRLPHSLLGTYFNKSVVGVSYIPITPWYNYQPPTKTFEYLLSNLLVLATKTQEHLYFKEDGNVFLVDDDVDAVVSGLSLVYGKFKKGELFFEKKNYDEFLWYNIVNKRFVSNVENMAL